LPDNLALHREHPDDPEVIAFLTERETYLQVLYPERVIIRRAVELLAHELAFYGLRQDGRIIGCGSLLRHPDFMELKKVFIAEAMRGRGLGRYLMAAIEAEARALGCKLLKLEVGTRQEAAVSLYRGLGYVETGPFSPYRPDPISRFMEKHLEA
jgi:putative acetyltransferase